MQRGEQFDGGDVGSCARFGAGGYEGVGAGREVGRGAVGRGVRGEVGRRLSGFLIAGGSGGLRGLFGSVGLGGCGQVAAAGVDLAGVGRLVDDLVEQ